VEATGLHPTLHKVRRSYFWRFVHTSQKKPRIRFSQLEGHGEDGNGVAGERKRRRTTVGLEILFALLAFGTVSFIWAIAPDKGEL